MKKAVICFVLIIAAVFAAEPHVRTKLTGYARGLLRGEMRSGSQTDEVPSFSEQIGTHAVTDMMDVTLYYRFGDTMYLGTQRAQLDIRREETVATSIVQQLVDGPAIAYGRLKSLFPQGTRVISVSGEDTTAFVTLSKGFLGKPDDAPHDWEDSFEWQEEAARRRNLAVQSIVLSLTEGGRYQRVQMYVADGDDDVPQRIPMIYFDPYVSDASVVLAASHRSEEAVLTPKRAMDMILEAWRNRDYQALHAMLAPAQDSELSALSVFETKMKDWDISLMSCQSSAGTISLDGKTATVVVDARIRSNDGGDAQIIREAVPLVRVNDNWAIAEDTLQNLMIRD